MKDKTIKVYLPLGHRSIELKVKDIIDIVPSLSDGCVCLVMKNYVFYKNRKTHCPWDKLICVKESALKKLGIYKVRDCMSHRNRIVFKGDVLAVENHEDGPFKGKFNLTLDRPHVYTAHDWVKIGLIDYIGEQDFDRVVVTEKTVKRMGYKNYPNLYVG